MLKNMTEEDTTTEAKYYYKVLLYINSEYKKMRTKTKNSKTSCNVLL